MMYLGIWAINAVVKTLRTSMESWIISLTQFLCKIVPESVLWLTNMINTSLNSEHVVISIRMI